MEAVLFVLLILLLAAALVGLVWWRFKGGGRAQVAAPVATSNHKSLPSFHYASAPAAPPLAAASPLALLLPEDEFFRQQQLELEAEADRAEAEEMELREQAQVPSVASVAAETANEIAPSAAAKLAPTPPDGAPATASVLDVLSSDEQPTASPIAETPTGPAESEEDAADDAPAESIYDNPLTSPTSTRNDEANRLAAVALRQRKRAAIMAKSGNQKTALGALLVNK